MSTFFSHSAALSFSFTLHPASNKSPKQAAANSDLLQRTLGLRMILTATRCQRLPLDSGAALGDVGDRDRKMAAQRDLSEQRLHRAYFRNRGIGKSADVSLDGRKIRGEIWVAHRNHRGFLGSML